ncbi:MAG TPA: hypothetical protein VFL36_21145 [Myxococcales bacterium]|nr:hypothetical protein [Myxococcales bacterium]
MRATTLVTAAIVMSGCAQGAAEPQQPAADVAASQRQTPAGNPPDAGAAPPGPGAVPPGAGVAPAGPCDPSIHPAVVIASSGRCAAILPAAATCAADLVLCNGGSNQPAAATSDGRGSVALFCAGAGGGSRFGDLFVPMHGAFVSRMALGSDVRPLADGFVTPAEGASAPAFSWDFLAHDGSLRASQPAGFLLAGPNRAVLVGASGSALLAQSFAADGTPGTTTELGTLPASAGRLMLGGAVDTSGAALVIWQLDGEPRASARWLSAGGAAATPAFELQGWLDAIPAAAPLAGGGIALAASAQGGSSAPQWRGIVAAGRTVEDPAPAWLAGRGSFFLLPGGKAMAFGSEIVAPDGTTCGTVDLGAPLLGVGVDGTAITAQDARTFRLYPQLFR